MLKEQKYIQSIHYKGINGNCGVCSLNKKLMFEIIGEGRKLICEDCCNKILDNHRYKFRESVPEDELAKKYRHQVNEIFAKNSKSYVEELIIKCCRILLLMEEYQGAKMHQIQRLYNEKFGFLSEDQIRLYLVKLADRQIVEKSQQRRYYLLKSS